MHYNFAMTKIHKLSVPETAYIKEDRTFCDGGIGALGHPRVYLTIDKKTLQVECPYCNKRFVKRLKKER